MYFAPEHQPLPVQCPLTQLNFAAFERIYSISLPPLGEFQLVRQNPLHCKSLAKLGPPWYNCSRENLLILSPALDPLAILTFSGLSSFVKWLPAV